MAMLSWLPDSKYVWMCTRTDRLARCVAEDFKILPAVSLPYMIFVVNQSFFLMRPINTLVTDSRYPITQQLYKVFAKPKSRLTKPRKLKEGTLGQRTFDRYDVVSESLCDDLIKYLSPTLDKHKGCTIVDINPGACLWSSKLHDYLKPKRHVLMEPESLYYDEFIKPLLDKPGSTYRHSELSGGEPSSKFFEYHQRIVNDENMAPISPLPTDDPRKRQLNPDVLVIGAMTRSFRQSKTKGTRGRNYAWITMNRLVTSMLANESYQRGGLVRMLLWWHQDNKSHWFPPTEMHRQHMNAYYNVGATMNEVAGTVSALSLDQGNFLRSSRPDFMELHGRERIERSMQRLEMEKPEGRNWVDEYPKKTKENYVEMVSPLIPLGSMEKLQEKTAETTERLTQLKESMQRKGTRKPRNRQHAPDPPSDPLTNTLEYPQCKASWKVLDETGTKASLTRKRSFEVLLDMMLRCIRLEASLKDLQEDSANDKSALSECEAQLLALDHDFHTWLDSTFATTFVISLVRVVESNIAHFLDPPLLAIEARDYLPLKAANHEVWPNKDLMLLDIVPKGYDVSVPGLASASDTTRVVNMLLRTLFESRSLSVPAALDRIAPNAGQDLVATTPAMTDARVGGRLNPRRVSTRMTTEQVIVGLAKAWMEWPFRPDTVDLELMAAEAAEAEAEAEKEGKGAAAEDD